MNPLDKLRFQDYFDKNLYLGTLAEIIDFTSPDSGGTYLISGGQVIHQTGLTFLVTAATYMINGVPYYADEQTHTLSAADPTLGRRDTFYLDTSGGATNDPDNPATSGDFGAVTGTPSSDPQEPSVDPETQIALVDILIAAGATTPSGVSSANIYDENVGTAGGEWDTFTNNVSQVDFDATVDPAKGSKHIRFAGDGSSAYMRFTDSSAATYDTEAKLVFSIKPIDKMKTQHYISIQLQDTGGDDYRFTNLRHGLHGFDGNSSTWQIISIPLVDFGYQAGSPPIQLDRLYFNVGPATRSKEFYIDDVYIQTGLPQGGGETSNEVKVGNTLFVDVDYGNDSTGERENFIKPYATANAAEADAISGDTIAFRPGSHTATAQLGKNGVKYYLQAGATLERGNSTLFGDGGGAVSFDVFGLGNLTNQVNLFVLSGSGTIRVDVNSISGTAASGRLINLSGTVTMYLNYNSFTTVNNDGILTASGTTLYVNGAFSSFTDVLLKASGNAYFIGNRIVSTSTNGQSDAVFHQGSSTLYAKVNKIELSGTDGKLARADGGDIILEGCTVVSTLSSPTTRFMTANSNGKLEFVNCYIESSGQSLFGTQPAIASDSNNQMKFIFRNCQLVNTGTASSAGGFLAENGTSGAGYATIELDHTNIFLHSTAVAAGAKAINENGTTLNYLLISDCRSNGAFDGTNLSSSTIGIVDSEVKSD